MIVALPVEGASMDSKIADSLGRAEYYLIYDTKKDEGNFIENKAIDEPSGAGIKSAQQLIDTNVDYIISERCGQKAGRVLDLADIKILKPINKSIENNIKNWKSLEKLKKRHSGHHKGGSN